MEGMNPNANEKADRFRTLELEMLRREQNIMRRELELLRGKRWSKCMGCCFADDDGESQYDDSASNQDL